MGISKLVKYCIYSLPRYQGGFSIMVQTGNFSLATLSQWRRIFQESELLWLTISKRELLILQLTTFILG